MRENLLAGMDGSGTTSVLEILAAELEPPEAKIILTTDFLLVTYPAAAPAPQASYQELFEELLLDLGGQVPAPGARLQDFPRDLDWILPARGRALRTTSISQPMARASKLPSPPGSKTILLQSL